MMEKEKFFLKSDKEIGMRKGYTYNESSKRYYSSISVKTKHIYLGSFDTAQEAQDAYKQAFIAAWGLIPGLKKIKE